MVVSISNVSPAHAHRYYTKGKADVLQDNQLIPELPPSEWYGIGSKALGLAQTVQAADLNYLLSGKLPDGTTLVDKTRCHQQQTNAKATGKIAPTERGGIDLTASAPKSVSLQALVFGDHQLEVAHQQANREMLRVLEERYACTRITQEGKRLKVCTGTLAIACFHHYASRALDPQLHTHNVILNLQRHPKTGRWQSLDNTEIYRAKMLLGQLYRNELACAVQSLGYAIHITNQQHGLWELDGFTAKQLRSFSTRLNQIEEAVGVGASSKAQAWAKRVTRPAKVEYDRDDLERYWQHQAQANRLTLLQPQPAPIQTETTRQLALAQVMRWLSDWIEQMQVPTVDRKELERKALQQPGVLPFEALQRVIETYLSRQSIIALTGNSQHVFQRVQTVFSQTNFSADSRATQQPLSGESHTQPWGRDTSQKICQTSTESPTFGEFLANGSQFTSDIGCQPETDAAWTHSTIGCHSERTGNRNLEQPGNLSSSHGGTDHPVATDDSKVSNPSADEQLDRRSQSPASEHGGVGTDAGANGEAVRLGAEFRALDALVAQILERHERRTMVPTENKARSNDSCLDQPDHNLPQETFRSVAIPLAQPLETNDLELEREW